MIIILQLKVSNSIHSLHYINQNSTDATCYVHLQISDDDLQNFTKSRLHVAQSCEHNTQTDVSRRIPYLLNGGHVNVQV